MQIKLKRNKIKILFPQILILSGLLIIGSLLGIEKVYADAFNLSDTGLQPLTGQKEKQSKAPAVKVPVLEIPECIKAKSEGTVKVPVRYKAKGNKISAVVFSLSYDKTLLSFDPTDSDEDGIPDAVRFYLPKGFIGSVVFDDSKPDGELDVMIMDINPPLGTLNDRKLLDITMKAGKPEQSDKALIKFSEDPPASFGSSTGQSIQGKTDDGSVCIKVKKKR